MPRVFTYLKKALRYPKGKVRFWVNAQCSHLITRKPLNVRMGKGKGARVRRYSKSRGGSPVAAMSSGREGVRRRIRRFIGIRLGTPISVAEGAETAPFWVRQWRTQAALIKERARELKALLKLIRRPLTKLFFARLFRLAWRRPRLKWRGRWPLLPSRAAGRRGRRLRWGGGFRVAAALWAGASSLAAGVWRRRRVRVRPLPPLRSVAFVARRAQAEGPAPVWGLGSFLRLAGPVLRAIADALKAAHLGGSGSWARVPQPRALATVSRLWDVHGIRLARLGALAAGEGRNAPLPRARTLGEQGTFATTLPAAALAHVGGSWRVDPTAGTIDQEVEGGGGIAAGIVYANGGGRILTRGLLGPLLLGYLGV